MKFIRTTWHNCFQSEETYFAFSDNAPDDFIRSYCEKWVLDDMDIYAPDIDCYDDSLDEETIDQILEDRENFFDNVTIDIDKIDLEEYQIGTEYTNLQAIQKEQLILYTKE